MRQWSCRKGNYNFVIVHGDDKRYVASYQETVMAVAGERRVSHYIGDKIAEGSVLPSFPTQTAAERACELKYKALRNKAN